MKKAAAAFLLAIAAAPAIGLAHGLTPALLQIAESADGHAAVEWKMPPMQTPGARVRPVLPPYCRLLSQPVTTRTPESVTARWSVDCGRGGLAGGFVGFAGLATARTDGLVSLRLADGRSVRRVVRAASPLFVVPRRNRPTSLLRDYARLGIEHTVSSLPHVLFVIGLVLVALRRRRLVETIAAFSVGLSVTLSLAVLGAVAVAPRPVELMIALGVFVLAVEASRPDADRPSLLGRWPWVMAAAFGLLHGLGFASALARNALPQSDVPLALLSFNAGIGAGDLLVVLLLLGTWRIVRPLYSALPRWVAWVPLYGMGSLAAFWCWQRAIAIFA